MGGKESFEVLAKSWDALGIEEPEYLPKKLQQAAQEMREVLHMYLEEHATADMEHVKVAVLESFDTSVAEKIESVCFNNRNNGQSFNKALRQECVEEYKKLISNILKATSKSSGERFQDVYDQDHVVISQYIAKCQGGSLAWPSFGILQEDLRFEQLAARDQIFGQDFQGKLPGIREVLNNAKLVVAFLGTDASPNWLAR